MPEFKPFSLRESVGGAIQDASNFTSLKMSTDKLNQQRRLSEISQTSKTPEELVQNLNSEGLTTEAMKVKKQIADTKLAEAQSKIGILEIIQKGADQAGISEQAYQRYTKSMIDQGFMQPGDLPEQYGDDAKAALKQLAVGTAGLIKQAKDNVLVEIGDPNSPTGTTWVPRSEAIGKPGKPKSGLDVQFDESGKVTRITSGAGKMGGANGITPTVKTDVQKKLISAGDTKSMITAIKNRFKPEFQEIGTRWGNMITAWKSKAGLNIDPKDKQALDEFTQYRAEAAQNFALVLKDMSGVAVNPTEFKRTEAWLPNPGTGLFDGDSPIELKAKIDRFDDFINRAMAKYHYIDAKGLTVNDVDVDQMPQIIRKRGEELTKKYSSGPNPLFGEDLKSAVKRTLSDEFGLAR